MKTNCRTVLFSFILILTAASPLFPVQSAKAIRVVKPEYTQGFSIHYFDDGVKQIRDNDGRNLWLVPRGRKAPSGVPQDRIIRIPLRRGLFSSVTQVCLLRPFGNAKVWKSIAGVATPAEQWFIPQVKTGLNNGSIAFIGDAYSPDYERIQWLQPEVAFIYTGTSGLTDLTRKLKELKIPYVVENSYLETSPLGRMEWVKFYAAFYNREEAADRYFKQVSQRVKMLKQQIPDFRRPKIAWGVIYNGKAYIPGSHSFVAKMISLAGGENVFKNLSPAKGSIAVSLEVFFAQSQAADIMIYASFPQHTPSIRSILQNAPVLSSIRPVKTGNVWVLQPWYNQEQDHTDQILYDLAAIFHPNQFRAYHVHHFKKLQR